MSDTLIPINVLIAGRSYRLKIEPSDEEMVRKTVKMINDKIVEYKTSFSGKDMQDYFAMVLLWFATEIQKPSAQADTTDATERLLRMEANMDKALARKY